MAKINDSPCNGCGAKHLGCRGDCPHWPAYAKRQEDIRAARLRESDLNHAAVETARKKAVRHTNKWGGKG